MIRPTARTKPVVVLGLLGTTLDKKGPGPKRWNSWRPTIGLCSQPDLVVDRFELLHPRRYSSLARQVVEDIGTISPETEVRLTPLELDDPWDFEQVFAALLDYTRSYPFVPDDEEYLVHISTGTHVTQICLFLLAESRHLPARLVQTSPSREAGSAGLHRIIDLDLSRYDAIAQRFAVEHEEGRSVLKGGIQTRNEAFNALMDRIERVAGRSADPLLLLGPTGAGKSQLARRIYDLKRSRRSLSGPLVEVNCATIRGATAMSTLFGHVRGAFTGAVSSREGLLRAADGGLLFLDEIGELGPDEQAMLLRAVEMGRFLPVGADREVESRFQLIAGTNRDLRRSVAEGTFREDLLARIDLWTFTLPALRDRPEDIAPNLDYELDQVGRRTGTRVRLNTEARERFLRFATDPSVPWTRNFRDLSAAVRRMATLSDGARISAAAVDEEIGRLRTSWERPGGNGASDAGKVEAYLGARAEELDRFDIVQLADVLRVCETSTNLSAAGRVLFARSRTRRRTANDADRLRKYLLRFGLSWAALQR